MDFYTDRAICKQEGMSKLHLRLTRCFDQITLYVSTPHPTYTRWLMYQCIALLFPNKASVLFGFLPSRHNCFCSPCSRTAPTGVKVWLSKDCRSGLCLYVTSLAACYYRPSTQSSAGRRVVVTLPLSSFPTVLLTVGTYCPFSLFRV